MSTQAPTVLDWPSAGPPAHPDPSLTGVRRPAPPAPASPPGFGKWAWWTPLVALAAGLLLLAGPLALLDSVEFPGKATVGEGLFGVVLLGSAWLLMSRFGGRPRAADLGLRRTPSRAAVGWVVVARITFAICAGVYVSAVGHVTPNVPTRPEGGVGTASVVDVVFAVVVLAPLLEELFFRGFMYAALRGRMSVLWASLVTGSLFAAIHPLYGATSWNLVPVLALGGIAMCLLYERTGSLWPAIAFHFVMNAGILWVVTGSTTLPLAIVGGLGLLFLLAPWRFFARADPHVAG